MTKAQKKTIEALRRRKDRRQRIKVGAEELPDGSVRVETVEGDHRLILPTGLVVDE